MKVYEKLFFGSFQLFVLTMKRSWAGIAEQSIHTLISRLLSEATLLNYRMQIHLALAA